MNTRKSLSGLRLAAILLAMGGLANGVLLGAFYSDVERAVMGALTVGLETGKVIQDPYRLAMHLQGLESSGLMACTSARRQVSGQSVVVYDSSFRGDCGGRLRNTFLPVREIEMTSSSGEPWLVSFSPTLRRSQLWSLVVANLLLLAAAAAALGWYRGLMRRRIHEQQTEIAGLHLIQNAFTQIAHDVRAPLSALNAVVSTLGPEAADEKEVLVSAAQRIRGIAEGLLKMKLYRPLVSHRPSPPQPEALTLGKVEECIEQIIAEKRYQYQQRVELRLESELESVAGQRVALDTVSLGRVLSNLIENSVESVKVTGFVGIRISTVRGFLLIEVRDNGSGIDANILPKLGRAGATFGKEGGTGLGLYHARVYFESLGGAFGIDSEPGKGTTISLAAPLLKGN